jgi:hypothetical protein
MSLGNVRPGGRYIVVDDASGMLVSAVLERLGGSFPTRTTNTAFPEIGNRSWAINHNLRCGLATCISRHDTDEFSKRDDRKRLIIAQLGNSG